MMAGPAAGGGLCERARRVSRVGSKAAGLLAASPLGANRHGARALPASPLGASPLARRRQRGLTLIGLLFLAVVIIVVGVVALRVVPSALEYMAIRNAVEKVVDSGAQTTRDLQMEFDRQAAVDDITSIRGSDLIVEKLNGATVVSFAYQKRIVLAGPVSLLIDYHGSSRN
jgi:Tfp pilus assembly protein PilE